MKTHLTKKSGEKNQQKAAAHQSKSVALEDNRPMPIIQQKKNNTGLPDNLKSGMESMSGHSLDDVKVHYNSSKPAQLNAHAYAQGSNIHLASGQEKHLAHEAWHVVQQKQGRVQPTTTISGTKVNDDVGLEKEADAMGAKALQRKTRPNLIIQKKATKNILSSSKTVQKMQNEVIQFVEIEKTLRNIRAYSPATYDEYGPKLITQVCEKHNLQVRGHASGKAGDGMNDATRQDLAKLIPYLRAAKNTDASAGTVAAAGTVVAGSGGRRHNEAQEKAAAEKKEERRLAAVADKKAKWLAKQQK